MQMKRIQTYKKQIDNIISAGKKTPSQRKIEINQFLVSLYKRQSQVLIFCNQNKICHMTNNWCF
jgi:diketogulonate reductase-like aldo/keto reductase